MIEPWHAPILVMAGIVVLEYLLGTTLPHVNEALAQSLDKSLARWRRAAVWALVLMLGTAAVVALFGLNVAGTLVGILGGLASVFAFLILIRNENGHNERGPGAPGPLPDTDRRGADQPGEGGRDSDSQPDEAAEARTTAGAKAVHEPPEGQ